MVGDTEFSLLGQTFFIPYYVKALLLAAVFGLVLGFERALREKVASIKTFAMISAGSCLFAILSREAAGSVGGIPYDATRVAAGIVTGIGFLGGGVIFKSRDRVEGITTGAMIWMAAAIGMACGFNQVKVALWGFGLYLGIIVLGIYLHRFADLLSGRQPWSYRRHNSGASDQQGVEKD
jgi:putative Mg2+ transporter-C (MgtC) family protein